MANRLFLSQFKQVLVGPTNSLTRLIVIATIGVCLTCIGSTDSHLKAQTVSGISDSNQARIEAVLQEQTKAWNEGDLERFMQTYWKSDKLTFSSRGRTSYGWQATLDNYKKSYPTKQKMGQLDFDGLEVAMIESNSALVLGKWHLKKPNESRADGNFSLVMKKFDSTWKIIHDHTSTLEPQDEDPESDK